MAADMSMTIRPLSGALGAEVLRIDLSAPMSNSDWSKVQDAFRRFHVIFFRDQTITPEQHIAFAKRFGALEGYPFVDGMPDHPELIEVVKLPGEVRNFGAGWHADMSFRAEPPLGAVLYAKEVPPVGGDTMFANLHAAYASLSDGMKSLAGRLRLIHDSGDFKADNYQGMKARATGAVRDQHAHPLVRRHPVTGHALLAVSPVYARCFEDMTTEESTPLLDYFNKVAVLPEHCCRFRWAAGSIAVWDNRCLLHNALNDDFGARFKGQGFKRVMQRATIATAAKGL